MSIESLNAFSMDFFSLKGKTAIVTGGNSGLGQAFAMALAKAGANIFIPSFVKDNGETKEMIEKQGVEVDFMQVDITAKGAPQKIIAACCERFGTVDILVNNAGITRDNLVLGMKEADFDDVININLKGTFNMIKHTYKHFMKKRYGRICSTASIVGLTGNAGQANYSASKAGIIGLTKSVAKELAGRGVTANAVAPGYIATDMTSVLPDKVKDAMKAQIPAKRIGTPDDVADVVAFLCSDDAAYVTGEVIRVDGGLAR